MSDSAKKYTIAVIPGDGIGKEVTPWAQKALEKAAEGVAEFEYEHFDLGAERYLRDGAILPEEEEPAPAPAPEAPTAAPKEPLPDLNPDEPEVREP